VPFMGVVVFVSFASPVEGIAMGKRARREYPDRIADFFQRPRPPRKPIDELPAEVRRAVSVLARAKLKRRRRA